MLLKIFCIIVLAIIQRSEAYIELKDYYNCPFSEYEKWFSIDNKTCYYFYDNTPDKYDMDWHKAYDLCHQLGGQLPSTHSEEQNQMLVDITRSHGFTDFYSGYWIGLNSLGPKRGDYKWSDNSPNEYTNYAIGPKVPNDVRKTEEKDLSIRGRCVNIINSDENNRTYGFWYYYMCNDHNFVVCEKNFTLVNITTDAVSTPTAPGNCPTDWIQYANEKCVQIVNNSLMTWSEAKNKCSSIGGELLSIHSFEEQNFINLLLPNQTMPFIGFNARGNTYQTKWSWDDQSRVTYTNWAAQVDNVDDNTTACVTIGTNQFQLGKWFGMDCESKHPTICEKPKDVSISPSHKTIFNNCSIAGFDSYNFVEFRNSCYLIVDNIEEQRDWDNAEAVCEEINASHLVSVVDPFEYSFLIYYLQQFANSKQFWIGLYVNGITNESTSQVFKWTDDWPNYFTEWDTNHPRINASSDKNCVYQSKANGKWSTDDCATRKSFICKTTRNPLPKMNENLNGFCPKLNGTNIWTDIDKRSKYCYWFSSDTLQSDQSGLSYTTAAHRCGLRNGTLTSIHSNHELLLFRSKIVDLNAETWIGLHQTFFGEFVWEDNTAVDYTNWCEHPDQNDTHSQSSTDDRCVAIRSADMTWIEKSCSIGYDGTHYICEIPKIFKTKSNESNTTSTSTPKSIIGDKNTDNNNGLSTGAKAGIVVGVFGLVSLIVLIGLYVFKKFYSNSTAFPSFQNSLYTSGRGRRTAESPTAEPVVVWSKAKTEPENKPPEVPKRTKRINT